MKKTATLVGALALSLLSFEGFSQFKLGVKAGMNVSTFGGVEMKDSEDQKIYEDGLESKIGYHVGLAADYGFTEKLSLQTGLMWTNKGTKFELSEEEDDFKAELKSTISLNYLEIPINLAYKMGNFQIHAGPYVAFGVAGKSETESTFTFMGDTETETDKSDIKFKNTVEESDFDKENVDYFRALDFGLNFGVGYMAGPVLLGATYSLGLSNTTPDADIEGYNADDSVFKNRNLGISATYFFGGK
jgi:hypothetical protein